MTIFISQQVFYINVMYINDIVIKIMITRLLLLLFIISSSSSSVPHERHSVNRSYSADRSSTLPGSVASDTFSDSSCLAARNFFFFFDASFICFACFKMCILNKLSFLVAFQRESASTTISVKKLRIPQQE